MRGKIAHRRANYKKFSKDKYLNELLSYSYVFSDLSKTQIINQLSSKLPIIPFGIFK